MYVCHEGVTWCQASSTTLHARPQHCMHDAKARPWRHIQNISNHTRSRKHEQWYGVVGWLLVCCLSVSCLMFHVSCLMSHVACLMSHVMTWLYKIIYITWWWNRHLHYLAVILGSIEYKMSYVWHLSSLWSSSKMPYKIILLSSKMPYTITAVFSIRLHTRCVMTYTM